MRPLPLQLWDQVKVSEWIVMFTQATDLLSAVIGLFIAFQAYRGYRRNESRPMLFIAIGFVLALAVPFALFVVYVVIPSLPETLVAVLTQSSQVAGLVAILYALRMSS